MAAKSGPLAQGYQTLLHIVKGEQYKKEGRNREVDSGRGEESSSLEALGYYRPCWLQ